MTAAQERCRLAMLSKVATTLLDGTLGAVVDAAASLAQEYLLVQSNEMPGGGQLERCLFDDALTVVGECLFRRLMGTVLCSPEPPDLGGARVLVQCALSCR